MLEAGANLLAGGLAALVFAVSARLAWKLGGCVGTPAALFLAACWAVCVVGVVATAARMVAAHLGLGGA